MWLRALPGFFKKGFSRFKFVSFQPVIERNNKKVTVKR